MESTTALFFWRTAVTLKQKSSCKEIKRNQILPAHFNCAQCLVYFEDDAVVFLQKIALIDQTGNTELVLGDVFAVFVAKLDESTVVFLIRIDTTQGTNNYTIEGSIKDFGMGNGTWKEVVNALDYHPKWDWSFTSWQQANIFSWNAISTCDSIARYCQWVFHFLTQFQVVGVANEVAKVKEDFLVMFKRLNEAEVVLQKRFFVIFRLLMQI